MMNSKRRGDTASLSCASMGFCDDSIPEYSLTRQTIVKSAYIMIETVTDIFTSCFRILLASIRNLGRCPCPRCLIPLNQIHNLAKPRDMARRITGSRVDSVMRRTRVSAARRLIYEKNMQVGCAAVEDLLYETSLVPTSVSMCCMLICVGG